MQISVFCSCLVSLFAITTSSGPSLVCGSLHYIEKRNPGSVRHPPETPTPLETSCSHIPALWGCHLCRLEGSSASRPLLTSTHSNA
ncbi:hypothetical protein BKA67DRAFT_544688 [Truncatella angustata]|uniref:Secreted protein n=1 Tax=Truncatella angustata TaxID=152316 RepID=A0A9P8UWA1_9PEZI|nr:uncharacterized protein BKA67DRAFT_544688 [Truncatella angustata]KAH6659517.1 hypothetical protein BKA67DRAFT_544688 [Truncatella angustata]